MSSGGKALEHKAHRQLLMMQALRKTGNASRASRNMGW